MLNADPVFMEKTASYFIVILKRPDGYIAVAPAFPRTTAQASSARLAYARLKTLIKTELLKLFARDERPPRDPVIQTRTLRVDLWYLRQQEELQ